MSGMRTELDRALARQPVDLTALWAAHDEALARWEAAESYTSAARAELRVATSNLCAALARTERGQA